MGGKIRILVLVMATAAGGFGLLISPGNLLITAIQANVSDTGARVITGPYPLESDFRLLGRKGVTTIVSLLDPRLPYEQVLIEREKGLARKYGMTLLSFPMTNIFGKPVREDYERTAAAAAEAVKNANGKVYLHCYLGLHRTKSVRNLLEADGVSATAYQGRKVERPVEKQLAERAEAEFNNGHYSAALESLLKIETPDSAARLLEAWSHWLGEIATASLIFEDITRKFPEQTDAHVGLGYCALRRSRLAAADQSFALALKMKPDDPSALVGMGMVRDKQQTPAEAAVYLRKALQFDSTNDEARRILRRIENDARKSSGG